MSFLVCPTCRRLTGITFYAPNSNGVYEGQCPNCQIPLRPFSVSQSEMLTAFSALPVENSPQVLRSWWHEIVRTQGKVYDCYGVFLLLPSDIEAIRYVTEFDKEISILSGKNCLIIAMNDRPRPTDYDEVLWAEAMRDHIQEGHGIRVSDLFNYRYELFPSLLIFRDIRSPENSLISLRNLSTKDISEELRQVFSTIDVAIKRNENPVVALKRQRFDEERRTKGESFVKEIRTLANESLQTVIEAWIRATIK